jgi:hypothetical protein
MRRKNDKITPKRENKIINTNASQNEQLQDYMRGKIEQAKKELEKIEKDIEEFK